MTVLSEESVSMTGSSFAHGIEFEETFPEAVAEAAAAHELAPQIAPAQEKLQRRLREAESLVEQTIERMRIEEERHLAEWVQDRRAEEERRLDHWVTERRTAIERSLDERNAQTEGLAQRLQAMIVECQARFEQRLEQRNLELERRLTERFARRQNADPTPLPERIAEVRMTLGDRVAATTSARDVGRVVRDALTEFAPTAAFALSVHHADRDEVPYRYRVAADDDLGALLRSDTLDDGPQSAAAHMDGWARAQVTMRVGSRNVALHTAQLAVRTGDATVGVLTLRTENDALADSVLARVRDLIALCASHLAALRDNGSYRSV
jgi:exonuclease VII large subunit